MLETIHKAGDILRQFTFAHPEWGATDLATQLSWPRSTVHGLLTSLAGIGLLERTTGGRYRVGWQTMRFGQSCRWRSDLLENTTNAFAELHAFYELPAYVAVLSNRGLVFVHWDIGFPQDMLNQFQAEFEELNFYSAAAKILWAARDWSEVHASIDVSDVRVGIPNTAAALETYRAELHRVALDGVATARGQIVPEWGDVAVPVYDRHHRVMASVGLIVPTHQITQRLSEYRHSLSLVAARLIPQIEV